MTNRTIPLLKKETLHILRDPRSLYLALGLPMVLLILFGYAITFDIKNVPVAAVDLDNTVLSRDLLSRIQASPYFDLKFQRKSPSGSESLLDRGDVRFIITIPSGFSRGLATGKGASLQLLVDGSDNNSAQVAMGYMSGFLQIFSSQITTGKVQQLGTELSFRLPPFEVEPRVWYNPDLRSTNFIVPGLIAVLMMVIAAMMTSLTVAREWEVGTMEQLIVAPIRPHEVILGKLLPYYFLGLIQTFLVILIGRLLFDVPFKGSPLFLFLVSSLFLICGLGIGLYISTATKSQQLSFMLSIILTLLPAFLLSGFIFPIASMPRLIQLVSYLVPAKYFLSVLRGIFLKGNGLAAHWQDVGALLIFAFIFVSACARKFKLSLE
ncbi:MAG: ABC transporter permease [Candidatus Aminicenantes bacterium]|jgi:ABC-2 type transport system permease protein